MHTLKYHCSASQISINAPIISFWRDSTKTSSWIWSNNGSNVLCHTHAAGLQGEAVHSVKGHQVFASWPPLCLTDKKHSYYCVVEMCNIEFLKLHLIFFCIEKTCSASPWRGGHCETCNESKVTSPELKKAFIPICCGSQNTQNTEERNISSMSQTSQPQVNACLLL